MRYVTLAFVLLIAACGGDSTGSNTDAGTDSTTDTVEDVGGDAFDDADNDPIADVSEDPPDTDDVDPRDADAADSDADDASADAETSDSELSDVGDADDDVGDADVTDAGDGSDTDLADADDTDDTDTDDTDTDDTDTDDTGDADPADVDDTGDADATPDADATDTDAGDADVETDTGPVDPCLPPRPTTATTVEGADAPDCFTGCTNDGSANVFDVDTLAATGYRGTIDGEPHAFPGSGVSDGPDIDIIGLQADTRTVVEVTVWPADPDSLYEPTVYLHDGTQTLTFNDTANEDGDVGRVTVAAPYVGDLPFFVIVEHGPNYATFGETGASYVGGENYGYILSVRTLPFEPVELGSIDGLSARLEATDQSIACSGDVDYYRFTVEDEWEPFVTFTRTGATDFVGTLIGLDAAGGQLVFETVNDDLDGDGSETLFGPAIVPGPDDGWYIAVTDWNGRNWPGAFTYDVSVVAD